MIGRVGSFLNTQNWTKGALARDDKFLPCDLFQERAVHFCLLGALERVYTGKELEEAIIKIYLAYMLSKVPEYQRDSEARKLLMGNVLSKARSLIAWYNDHSQVEWSDIETLLKMADV